MQSYFIQIPSEVLQHPDLSDAEAILYGRIRGYAEMFLDSGEKSLICFASNETLGEAFKARTKAGEIKSKSVRAISRMIANLERLNFIHICYRRTNAGETRYIMPFDLVEANHQGETVFQRVARKFGINPNELFAREDRPASQNLRSPKLASGDSQNWQAPLAENGKLIDNVNIQGVITHTPAPEEAEPAPQPDSESLYDMIKARLAFAPNDLKDKWAKKGLRGEELKTLIELFATKEVGKIKGDAFEVREEVERLCSTPNYWARLFTNSYVPKWTPPNQATRKGHANYHEAPKMSPPRRGPMI